jgi:hypothetical protein
MTEMEFDLAGPPIPSPWCSHSEDGLALEKRGGRDGYQSPVDDIEPPLAIYEMIRGERRRNKQGSQMGTRQTCDLEGKI